MSVFSHVDGLGGQVEVAVADSVLAWRDEHAKAGRHVDVIAERVASIDTQLSMFPGGYASFTCRVLGRKRWEDTTYVFRFKRKGSGTWERSGDSLPEV